MTSWKFFPVICGGKQPALPGDWRLHATDDIAQIEAWEAAGHNLGIDCEASGLVVIDLDGDEVGRHTWAELIEEHGAPPPTFTVATPRGGLHYYFEGEAATSVQKLGPKIDTRGRGGYVLAAGSVVDGKPYSALHDLPPVRLPAWVPQRLAATAEHRDAAVVELDQPQNIQRAIAWLQGREPAVQGDGADAKTFEAACRLRDFGLSPDKIIDVMLTHYKLTPIDDRHEAFITRKVENAHEYGQNDAGAWGVTSGSEAFAGYLDSIPKDAGGDSPDPYKAYSEAEQDAFTEPTWLARDLLPADSVVMLYGPPGSYKSFVALDIGMTLASGVPGWDLPAGDQHSIVYVAGEGPRSIGRLRRPAWRQARGVSDAVPFHLVTTMPLAAMPDQVHAFCASILAQGQRPRLVVIDTLARFMLGLNENDAKDCGQVVAALEYIKRALHCTVLVIHHTGKDAERGSRGSNALIGGIDTQHEVVAHKETKALAVHNRRQKDGEERAAPWLFEGKATGKSLVFHPITPEAFRQITQSQDALGPKVIGAALSRLNARGKDHAITTQALASTLHVGTQEEAPEATLAATDRLQRQLRAASRGRLEVYCERDGRELLWFMPA